MKYPNRTLVLLLIAGLMLFSCSAPAQQRQVTINKVRLSNTQVQALEQHLGGPVYDGNYWYDRQCGAWGYLNGPTAGYITAGLNLGGSLSADASNGRTGVFVNGRQLHSQDVALLKMILGVVYQGRYWMDASGNYGVEGGVMLGNLPQAVQAMQYAGNNGYPSSGSYNGGYENTGNTFYRGSYTDIGAGSSGGTTYVIGSDFSYISGN